MPKKDILNNIFNKKIDCSEDKCTDSSSSQFTINSQFSAKETDMSDTQEANNFPILIPGAPCSPPQKVIINYGVDGGIIDVGNLIQGDNIILTGNTVGRLVGIGDVVIEAVIPPVDLSNYYTKTETDALLLGKVDVSELLNYYTKTELQTSGQSQVNWDNLTNVPSIQSPLTFENGLREDGGVVKLGLDLTTIGTTNEGLLTEDTYLVKGDVASNIFGGLILSDFFSQLTVNTALGVMNIGGTPEQIIIHRVFGGNQSINFEDSSHGLLIQVTDEINQKGLEEAADYSDNKTQYSYVTKMMLDAVAAEIPDLTGYATEQWVLDRNYLTGVTWGIITGDQSVVGNAGFNNTANFITADDLPELADVAYSGDYNDLINLPTIPDLTGYATEQWVLDQNYITGVTWGDITGSQSVVGNAGFNNTANYITLAQVPDQVQTDWLATTGLASILNKPVLATVATTGDYDDLINKPSIPDLSGYATEAWVTSQGYLTSVAWDFDVNTGDLTIDGTTNNLDGRWLERAEGVITPGYGITVNGDLATGMGIELDTTVVDNRYLRKDVNDSNGAFALTLGELTAGDSTFTESVVLESVGTGTTDEVLLYGPGGVIQRKTLTVDGQFGIANAGGTKQFDVALGTNLRIAGDGDTSISFNSSTNTVTITSIPGSGTGGVITSVFGRTTSAIVAETGDYNTSQVTESGNLYFTEARVRGTDLAGFTVGSNAAISATDTVLSAFGKTQGQINARVPTSRTISVSGTSGNIAISGTPTQNLGSNAAWTINLATVGTAGANKTKVTTDAYGRVIGSAALTMGDLPSGVSQTLSINSATSTTPFRINISGGNSINPEFLQTQLINSTFDDVEFLTSYMRGWRLSSAVGGFSSASTGIRVIRQSTADVSFGFDVGMNFNTNKLLHRMYNSNGWSSIQTVATESWSDSRFVNTYGNQSDILGNKTWSGRPQWILSTNANIGSVANIIGIGKTDNGLFLQARNSSNTTSFTLRGYNSTMQLDLLGGGVGTPRGASINSGGNFFAGGFPILSTNNGGTNISPPVSGSGIIYISPLFGSSTGRATFSTTSIVMDLLSGSGTRMVTASSSGVLSTQAIPSIPAAQTLSFSTLGQLTISSGNTVNINRLRGISTYADAQGMLDGMPTGQQVVAYSHTTGATGFSTAVGAGILSWRPSGATAASGFMIERGTAANDELSYATIAGNGVLRSWQTFASQSWSEGRYVSSINNHNNIQGWKRWVGYQIWDPEIATPSPSPHRISVYANSVGAVIRGNDSDSGEAFYIRTYSTDGVQLTLNKGGISAPLGPSSYSSPIIYGGSNPILGMSTTGAVTLMGAGSNILLRPNGIVSDDGMVTIAATGLITMHGLSGGGTQMVVANNNGQLIKQPIPSIPAAQTLSRGSDAGQIILSGGGGNVTLQTLSRQTWTDFEEGYDSAPVGIIPVFSTTGATGFPSATSQGIVSKRGAGSASGSFAIFKSSGSSESLRYKVGTGTNTWTGWETFASRAWTDDNFVNTTSNQGSILGQKFWTGNWHQWTPGSNPTQVPSTVTIGQSGNSPFLRITSTTNGLSIFRGYATDGVQLMLSEGGVSFPKAASAASGVFAGSDNILYSSTNGNTVLSAISGEVYLRPTSATSAINEARFGSNILLTALAGSGTQMVTVTSTGVLGRAAIPNPSGRFLSIGTGDAANISVESINFNTYYQSGAFRPSSSSDGLPWDAANTTGFILQMGGSSSSSAAIALSSGGTNYNGHLWFRNRPSNGWFEVQNAITGGASTITSSNLTANRALISNGSGKVAVSAVTSTELSRLDGVTSNVQTQLNGKAPTSHTHTWSQLSGGSTGLIPGSGSSTTYGSLNISGSKQGYSGINFTDADGSILMISNTSARSGVYKGGWIWAFEGNGELYAGTVPWGRVTGQSSLVAGDGLTGGGNIANNFQVQLGTPGSITSSSTNAVTATSHTHALANGAVTHAKYQSIATQTILGRTASGSGAPTALTAAQARAIIGTGTTSQYIRGDGSIATFPSIPAAVSLVTAGVTTVGAVRYAGTTRTTGQFYGGTTNPTNTTRLNFDGVIYASTFRGSGASSDIRLKENIIPISDPIGKLSQLRGYSFRWKKGNELYSGNDYGLIAQEVEKVLPHAIGNLGGYKTIKQENQLISLLVAGVNELVKENKSLIERVEALENGLS